VLSGVGSGAASEADFFFYPAAAGAAPYPTLHPRTRAAGARLPLGPSVAGPPRQRGRRLAGPRARRARAGAARVPQLGHVGQLTVTPARGCVLAARAFVPAPPGQARCPPGQARKRYRGAPLALEQSREAPRARARPGPDAWPPRAGWSTRFPDDGEVTDAMGVYLQHALPALAGLQRSPLNLAAAALQVRGA